MSLNMGKVKATYEAFANQGKGSVAQKKDMDNKAWSKMCKDLKIQDGKKVTSADVDITFSKHKTKGKQTITFDQFVTALRELGTKKYGAGNGDKIFEDVEDKQPGLAGTTKTSKTGGVAKMTDTSQYTGSHKERFDASGHGKGMDGRKDMDANTGYVGNYKGDGTYDAKAGK